MRFIFLRRSVSWLLAPDPTSARKTIRCTNNAQVRSGILNRGIGLTATLGSCLVLSQGFYSAFYHIVASRLWTYAMTSKHAN